MGAEDKIRNMAEELKGRAKEGFGRTTGDRRTEAEGRGERTKASLKQAAEKVKDALRPKNRH
ncbi:CsbD family protein [Saccharothrix violaceirubra]|uniref:Uncharacterized protein YjbJ (UPF0337 family) n=1 Tax=Saccharothrix violaceirubra TaxID=413306 RepID=A0A7W7WUY0_9PSEU|nr:CsbD family protein [Saccharothrix violaceirubra]MBB4964729.1 uncharacterized protein YjbJ (UPF0337 family) [Saccharothrix violaceirubra]